MIYCLIHLLLLILFGTISSMIIPEGTFVVLFPGTGPIESVEILVVELVHTDLIPEFP